MLLDANKPKLLQAEQSNCRQRATSKLTGPCQPVRFLSYLDTTPTTLTFFRLEESVAHISTVGWDWLPVHFLVDVKLAGQGVNHNRQILLPDLNKKSEVIADPPVQLRHKNHFPYCKAYDLPIPQRQHAETGKENAVQRPENAKFFGFGFLKRGS